MEERELRIGNIVQVENDYETVTAIFNGRALCALDANSLGIWQKLKDIKPIALTDDWFLKFGFTNILNYWEKGRFKIIVIEGRWFLDCYVDWQAVELVYVHDLQNLFHAIKRKELTIKETINK